MRVRIATILSVLVLLAASGCGTTGGFTAEAEGYGIKFKIATWWATLNEAQQDSVRQAACQACDAFKKLRDQFQQQADATASATDPGQQAAHQAFKNNAEHFGRMVERCEELQHQYGRCEAP
ncbi:MAG: hypothetical protein GTO22_07200 [Gemmatimonadales bacterium]|nr:hypothetical protein [Gemmatimonadales bacterium]